MGSWLPTGGYFPSTGVSINPLKEGRVMWCWSAIVKILVGGFILLSRIDDNGKERSIAISEAIDGSGWENFSLALLHVSRAEVGMSVRSLKP